MTLKDAITQIKAEKNLTQEQMGSDLEGTFELVMERAGLKMRPRTGIEDIVKRQRSFFATEKTIDVEFRIKALESLKAAFARHEEDVLWSLHEDLGKSFFDGRICEVLTTYEEIDFALENLREWVKPQPKPTAPQNEPATSYVVAEPYGVTLVMSPWNYPYSLTIHPLVGAIAAGNCCVVKPSAYGPCSSMVIAAIVEEAFEAGHVDTVLGGREANSNLLEQRWDYILFTGSTNVGKVVAEKAARNLTPVTLELGGKSPCIIAPDANLDATAEALAFGKYLNLGQTCVAPDYALVDKSIQDEFVEKLKATVIGMYGADAFENPDYGHIINKKHFNRVMGLIEPDKVVLGGRGKEETLQIEPTIMVGVTGDDPIMQQEIFGPVMPIITVENTDEAIEFVKNREKPLALYLFTENQELEDYVTTHVPYGGGCINGAILHITTCYLPFGGVGFSGMGNYHGYASFETFSHMKSILSKKTK